MPLTTCPDTPLGRYEFDPCLLDSFVDLLNPNITPWNSVPCLDRMQEPFVRGYCWAGIVMKEEDFRYINYILLQTGPIVKPGDGMRWDRIVDLLCRLLANTPEARATLERYIAQSYMEIHLAGGMAATLCTCWTCSMLTIIMVGNGISQPDHITVTLKCLTCKCPDCP
jgi:hypothetical protein